MDVEINELRYKERCSSKPLKKIIRTRVGITTNVEIKIVFEFINFIFFNQKIV